MALIPYVDESKVSDDVRDVLSRPPKLNITRMIAHSDAALRAFGRLGNRLLRHAKLDPRLREIAILRVAKLCRSTYEWTQHVPIAKSAGVSDEQIAAMENWEPARCYSDIERKVLRLTDEITREVKGHRETVMDLTKNLGHAELVELILSIGFWGMVARLLETLEVDLEPFAGKVNITAVQR
jgi:alkylhydroperoxidase family enzyme